MSEEEFGEYREERYDDYDDYTNYDKGDIYEEYQSDDDLGGDRDGDYDSSIEIKGEELDYGYNFKDLERIGAGEQKLGGSLGKFQKAIRDPAEKALDELNGIIYQGTFSHFDDSKKDSVIKLAKKIKYEALPLMNGEILAATLMYIVLYGKKIDDLNKKNINLFLSQVKSSDIKVVDLIRYFRYVLSNIK